MDPARLSPLTRLKSPGPDEGGSPRRPEPKLTAGVPLAMLIKRKLVKTPDVVALAGRRTIAAEKFSRLRALLTSLPGGRPQVLVLTSAGPGEGKSVCSLNLALAFASESTRDVLLIDGDLRRPTLCRRVQPAPTLGLAEVLEGRTELDHAILNIEGHRLKVLPAGSPPRDPGGAFASDVARRVFRELRRRFDTIIVDTPPVVPFTDADVVGALADGVVMVARSGVTETAAYVQAVNSITSAPILGAVFNDQSTNLAARLHEHNYASSYRSYYEKRAET